VGRTNPEDLGLVFSGTRSISLSGITAEDLNDKKLRWCRPPVAELTRQRSVVPDMPTRDCVTVRDPGTAGRARSQPIPSVGWPIQRIFRFSATTSPTWTSRPGQSSLGACILEALQGETRRPLAEGRKGRKPAWSVGNDARRWSRSQLLVLDALFKGRSRQRAGWT